MIRSFSIALLVMLAFTTVAQNKKEIVVTIGDQQISKEEFEANYKKNNTNTLEAKDKKTPEEYLDLFVNFKLKVLEAQKLGYDTVKSFVNELKGYREELAKPYLTDVSFNEEMVKTAYYRTQFERKASHILIRVAPEASPADTLAAWNKISDIRKQIIDGADFNEMAAKHSEDPSAAQNKGELGYFGAFQMVYPFENAAYNTPVGQVSQIIRTRFGYHILKVEDERETPGEIKVAHIMISFPKQASDETIEKLKLRADSVWELATSGSDFADLAKKYSNDKFTAQSGGEMNWFTSTNFPVKVFSDAAFALQKDGDISAVVRTPYGWHIIKRLELRKTQPFDVLKADLESKIKQNPQISKYRDDVFEQELKKAYQFKLNDGNFSKVLVVMLTDTTKMKEVTEELAPIAQLPLVDFADKTYTCGDFAQYMKDEAGNLKLVPNAKNAKSFLDKFISGKLLEYEDSQLEVKHPDFAAVYREYHDGILLFNISKDKIWDVASSDTARLENYYNNTTKKYFWNERFKGLVLQAKDLETRNKVETALDGKEMSKEELNSIFNPNGENDLQITEVSVEKGDNPVVDYYIWNGPKPAGFNETTTFVHGKTVGSEQKTLKDAWGLYSSDFQEQIEKEWIDSLRAKYPIVVNKKVLKKIAMVE